MNDSNLTDDELIRAVDNDPGATPRERELAQRLDTTLHQDMLIVDDGDIPNG